MDLKIEVFNSKNTKFLQTSLNLRYEIYTDELKIDKFQEFDGLDDNATHYIIFIDMMPVGIARWRKLEDYILIDRFGIKKEYRGKGYGFLLLKYIVDEISISKFDIQLLTLENESAFIDIIGFTKIVEEIELSGLKMLKLLLEKKNIKNG